MQGVLPYIKHKAIIEYPLLVSAIVLAMLMHGVTFIHTMPKTYDAYVHIFFADHYARHWFEPWEYRWYTGFSVTSYPPLLHQIGAILSHILGLKAAFILIFFIIIAVLVIGVYRFSKIWVHEEAAQYAAVLTLVTPSIVEAAHVFGQLPTLMGISLLLNALPDVYYYVRGCSKFHGVSALSLLLVVACSHHVTLIFGQVFFIVPTIALAIFDKCEVEGVSWQWDKFKNFVATYFKEALKSFWRVVPFMTILLVGIVVAIFPYWYLTKTDPIAQVSIPHGSRDNFLFKRSSGVIFFAALWGMLLPFYFYALRRSFQHRNLILLLPLSLLFIFGTGGTTPIPKILLGTNAFNILTLDRFSFWATILTLPFAGELLRLIIKGKWGKLLETRLGKWAKKLLLAYIFAFLGATYLILTNLSFWDITQPQTIDIKPITNFLSRDEHNRWRFLTLGFGDQIAWLSANTDAQCVDGNYHSARRLPELVTRAVERLENSKFSGVEGIGSLQQFLTVPEKYYLKYIFSNDKFYEPLLHYTGWHKVQRLENGIVVWEKQDVPKLPPQSPAIDIPRYQKMMWGIIPISILAIAILIRIIAVFLKAQNKLPALDIKNIIEQSPINDFSLRFWKYQNLLIIVLPLLLSFFVLFDWMISFIKRNDPEKIVVDYYNYLDIKHFANAHRLFGRQQALSFEQYALEISVEDGILNSFAKLDNITTSIVQKNDSAAIIKAHATWITPLSTYAQTIEHLLLNKNGKWVLTPKNFDLSIPPDEAFRRPNVQFYNQGKRRVSTTTTNLEDVLDRPELNILHAKLIKRDSIYSIVGEIQNTDNYPAHISVSSLLYDKNGIKITEYNPMFHTNHKILPKEITPFRIDFEEVSEKLSKTFKPDAYQPFVFKNEPIAIKIFAQAVSEEREIYKNIDIQELNYNAESNTVQGQLINSGVYEVTIPQMIVTFYNQNDEVIWVEKSFLPFSIRPQRKEYFNFKLPSFGADFKEVYTANDKDKYVNGILNKELLQKNLNATKGETMPTQAKMYIQKDIYIKISVNCYIATLAK